MVINDILHDKDIREPLFEFLDIRFGKNRILEEKTTGRSRADVVMITETDIIGIEIKSDADSYTRLSSQIRDYNRYYDFNYVVVGTSHSKHIEEHVPDYWGIITVANKNGSAVFDIMREAGKNHKVTWSKKLEIMWRPELAMIQIWNKMPKYDRKSKMFVKEAIVERIKNGKIKEEELKKQVSYLLLERDYNDISRILREYRKNETKSNKKPAEKNTVQS